MITLLFAFGRIRSSLLVSCTVSEYRRCEAYRVSRAIRDVIGGIDPRLPFIRFDTMEQVISRDLEMQRFVMTLLSVFVGVSLTMATVGIYGLLAYTASQRTQEIGVRIASVQHVERC